jgi:hypothetical protein
MRLPAWLVWRSRQKQRLRDLRTDIERNRGEIEAARELFEEARRRTNAAFVDVERQTMQTRIDVALLQEIGRGLDGT